MPLNLSGAASCFRMNLSISGPFTEYENSPASGVQNESLTFRGSENFPRGVAELP
jgi:hypothetical protein